MTLAAFVSTAVSHDDIGAALDIDFGDNDPVQGVIYDGRFYIELNPETGDWTLLLERDVFVSPDLRSLEVKLWAWAQHMDELCAPKSKITRLYRVTATFEVDATSEDDACARSSQ